MLGHPPPISLCPSIGNITDSLVNFTHSMRQGEDEGGGQGGDGVWCLGVVSLAVFLASFCQCCELWGRSNFFWTRDWGSQVVEQDPLPQLSGVAWEWDPRSFSNACDGGTGCFQEAWCFSGLCPRPIILHTVQEYFWCAWQGQMLYVWGGQTIQARFPKRQGKDSPSHCLSERLLVLMQDWAFLCRWSVLDRPNA